MTHDSTGRMRIVFLVNTSSGIGHAAARAERVARLLREGGHDAEVETPKSAEAMDERVRAVAGEVDRLGVVGGDGTIQRVLETLPENAPPVVVLPAGTANVLAREIGWPLGGAPEAEAKLVAGGAVIDVDVLQVNGRHRTCLGIGAGYDGSVVRAVHRDRNGPITMLHYVLPALAAWRRARRDRVALHVDGECVIESAGLVVVWNTVHYAGAFRAFPAARVDDGVAEASVLPRVNPLSMFALTHGWRRGSGLRRYSGTRFRIEAAGGEPVTQLGGDPGPDLPVTIEVLPRAFRLVTAAVTPG